MSVVSDATLCHAGKGSSRNASLMGLLLLGHGARADSKHWFITSVSRLEVGPQPALRGG
jgi:hypothetical protein